MSAPTISSSVLFNLNTIQLTYSDNTNYSSYGIATTAVDGNLKCTGPNGVFYNNTSWSPPSIDLATANTINVNLPNLGGVVYSGTYTFLYTIRVLTQLSIVTSNTASGFFQLLGDQQYLFPTNHTFTIVGGPNAGTYSVASLTYDGTHTKVFVNEAVPTDASSQGTINVYNEYTNTKSYYFSDCAPTVSLQLTSDCDCSQIVSQDLTNYTVNVNGNYYSPTTTARIHTVNPPISPSTGTRVAGSTTSSEATIIVSPAWTNTWTSTVVTTLTYNIGGLLVQKTASGSASVDVVCSDELCCAYACLGNIADTYNEFRLTNRAEAEKWGMIALQVAIEWVAYSVARSCGQTNAAETRLENILALTKKSGCSCCEDQSAEPVEIIGLCAGGSVSGSGANVVINSCGNGITVTPVSVGNTITYTVCLDVDVIGSIIADYLSDNPLNLNDLGDVVLTSPGSGSLLRFNGVNWVNVPSIAMSQITDFLVTSPTVGQVLSWNGSKWVNSANTGTVIDIPTTTYTSSGTSTQTLQSVTLDNTTFPANKSMVQVHSEWVVSNDVNSKTVIISIGGTDIATPALNISGIGRVFFDMQIIRVSSTQVRLVYSYRTFGNSSGRAYPELSSIVSYADPLTYTVSNMDTLSNTLSFRCNPTAGGSTITLFDYTVLSFKKYA